jgi:hypothetical protein
VARSGRELNTDGAAESITREEFTAAVENPGFIDKVVIPYRLGLLSLFDDGDGQVNLSEWMNWKTGAGLSQIEALGAFQEVDAEGDGYITVDVQAAPQADVRHLTGHHEVSELCLPREAE